MSHYWFRPKSYGWGFTPISWEGWLATLLMLTLVLTSIYINGFFHADTMTFNNVARFILDLFFIIGCSSYFFEKKTNGQLKWNWGGE